MSEQFEHKVQQLLNNIELEPGEAVWHNIKQNIQPDKRKRRFAFWWLLPILLTGTVLIYLFEGKNIHQDKAIAVQQINNTASNNETNKQAANNNSTNELIKSGKSIHTVAKASITSSVKPHRKLLNDKNSSVKTKDASINIIEVLSEEDKGDVINDIVDVKIHQLNANSVSSNTKKDTTNTFKENKKFFEKSTDTTQAQKASITSINKEKKRTWRFGIVTEVGMASQTRSLIQSAQPLSNQSATSGSGVFTSLISIKETINKGPAFGAGIIAQRKLTKRIDFNTSLSYQYQSFDVRNNLYKDSLAGTYPVYRSITNYKTHFLNFSAGINYHVFKSANSTYGAGVALDNMYLIQAHRYFSELWMIGTPSSNMQKSNTTTFYNKWQPQLNVTLSAAFTTKRKELIQLSPYFRFGLRQFDVQKQNSRQLMSFGLSTRYFFK